MAGRDELREDSNPCKAEHFMAQQGETRICILEVELKMDASQTVKEYVPATWAENTVKFEL